MWFGLQANVSIFAKCLLINPLSGWIKQPKHA